MRKYWIYVSVVSPRKEDGTKPTDTVFSYETDSYEVIQSLLWQNRFHWDRPELRIEVFDNTEEEDPDAILYTKPSVNDDDYSSYPTATVY